MSYDGREVANFILDTCEGDQRSVTNLALQKITYFCHAWTLVRLRRPLIRHKFEAWELGPVLPYLYREFRSYDRSPIQGRAKRINRHSGALEVVPYAFDATTEEVLMEVVGFYSRMRAGDLVELTHAVGSPWYRVWNHESVALPGMQIDDAETEAFYSKVRAPFTKQ